MTAGPLSRSRLTSARTQFLMAVAGALAFSTMVLGLLAWQSLTARDTTLTLARLGAQQQAQLLGEHAARTLDAVDLILNALATDFENPAGRTDRGQAWAHHHAMRSHLLYVPQAVRLEFYDSNGRLESVSDTDPPPATDQSDAPFFRRHRDRWEEFVLETPVPQGPAGRWVIPLSRRISDQDGTMTGVLRALVSADYLRDFYVTNPSGELDQVILFDSGGVVLASWATRPEDQVVPGSRVDGIAALAGRDAPRQISRGLSVLETGTTLAALYQLSDFPLRLAVIRGRSESLAGWRRDTRLTLFAGLAVLVATGSFLAGALLHTRHREAMEETLRLRDRALAASSNGVIITGPVEDDRPIEYVNPGFIALTGYAPEDVLGRNPRFLHGQESDQPGLEQIRRALAEQREAEAVIRNYRKDGTPYWAEVHVAPVQDESGRVTHYLGVQRDITARRAAEDALRESRAAQAQQTRFLESLLEALPLPVYVKDIDSRFLLCNQSYCQMTGLPREALIGRTMAEAMAVGPDALLVHNEADRQLLAAGGKLHYETAAQTPAGRRRELLYHKAAFLDGSGRIAGVIGAVLDLTERKAAEAALAASEALYRAIFDKTAVGILRIGDDGRILQANPALCRMLSLPAEEVAGRAWLDVTHPADRESSCRLAEDLLSGRQRHGELEKRCLTRDGSTLWVHATMTRVDPPAAAPFLVGMVEDITERRRTAEALAGITDELRRSNQDLEQFSYAVSHDLQEPLRMVASYVQLLARRYRGKLDADADDFIAFAVDGAQRMQRMISDLLEFSRVRSRGSAFSTVSLEAALDEALANLALSIQEAGAKVTRGPLPQIIGDVSQMVRLLQNLVGNAVKYRAPGQAPHIRVSAEPGPAGWTIAVADDGIGIPAADRERIFGVFQRLHGRGDYAGTGVGLAVCRRIVERHGGRIWAESADPGPGSVFRFTLPLAGPPDRT